MKPIRKIAIVDDIEIWRDAISHLICKHKRQFDLVLTARDGVDFIEKIEGLPEGSKPDVVLLDISMPRMDGFETAEWLAKSYPHIRVFALSLNNDSDSIKRMADLNAEFIYKAANPREIMDKVCC